MENTAGPDKMKPTEKHRMLNNAINRLEDVNNSFLVFIEKVSGCPSPREEAIGVVADKGPSLYEILNLAPNRIAEIAEGIQRKIDELDEILF